MAERRNALKIIGTIGATCAFPFAADELYAQQEHTHGGNSQAVLPEPAYFSKEDFSIVAAMAECIIPATDTPGAIGAGVPAYIDFVVGRSPEQQKLFTAGLEWLKKESPAFPTLGLAGQTAVLQPLSDAVDRGEVRSAGQRFFRAVKALTSDGYWTSKVGMAGTLGFKHAAMLAAYPECKEH